MVATSQACSPIQPATTPRIPPAPRCDHRPSPGLRLLQPCSKKSGQLGASQGWTRREHRLAWERLGGLGLS